MLRTAVTIAILGIALASAPCLGETWDCGTSTAYSNSFKLDTEVSACAGWTVASTGFMFDTVWSPGTVKKRQPGTTVTLPGLPITRTFTQRFYIEALDRSSGIGALATLTADPGQLATVTGTLTDIEGEMVLTSPNVTFGALGEAPEPLAMASSALRLGIGLDPTGLLVTVWGRAISVPPGETWYLISDGGTPLIVCPEAVPRPAEGEYVILTGVPGVAEIGGSQVRVLRINAQ